MRMSKLNASIYFGPSGSWAYPYYFFDNPNTTLINFLENLTDFTNSTLGNMFGLDEHFNYADPGYTLRYGITGSILLR